MTSELIKELIGATISIMLGTLTGLLFSERAITSIRQEGVWNFAVGIACTCAAMLNWILVLYVADKYFQYFMNALQQ